MGSTRFGSRSRYGAAALGAAAAMGLLAAALAADAPSLEGRWAVKGAGARGDRSSGGHWVFEKDRIALHRGTLLEGHMRYRVDSSKSPREIDLTPESGPARGKLLKGIYFVEGDTLKLCYASPAEKKPEEVARPRGIGDPGTLTFVLAREKP